jgi:hypothetical protein
MKIKINHLHYTVIIKDRRKFKDYPHMLAVTQRDSKNQSTIYISLPLKKNLYGSLVHEITHILQFICRDRGIDFTDEMEHTAYIAHYIFNEATGYEYI